MFMAAPPNEVYPRAPLTEAIFEMRFPGEPSIDCHRDEVFDVVRSWMPVVQVPPILDDEAFKFRTYRFASEDDAFTLFVGLNLLAFSSKRYNGFQEFRKQFLSISEFFIKRFRLSALRRTGLRYVNTIPFTRENGSVPLNRYLNSELKLAPTLPDGMDVFSFALSTKLPGGTITTRIATIERDDKKQESILLDFDYAKVSDLTSAKIADYLDESHQQTKQFFEGIITPQYRGFIRGTPVT